MYVFGGTHIRIKFQRKFQLSVHERNMGHSKAAAGSRRFHRLREATQAPSKLTCVSNGHLRGIPAWGSFRSGHIHAIRVANASLGVELLMRYLPGSGYIR